MSDPDIQALMSKYPSIAKQAENRSNMMSELRSIIRNVENYLDFESAEYDCNLAELKVLLDREQFSLQKKAAELLAGASDIENRNLKTHLNYTLATMRDAKEMEREVIHEYFYSTTDPKVTAIKMKILRQATLQREKQREWKRKLSTIMEKAGKSHAVTN